MARIQMYTTAWCGFCDAAKRFLDAKGVAYDEVHVDGDPSFRQKLFDLTGYMTVPQIVIDGNPVGGYSDLRRLDVDGRLDELLAVAV